MPFIIKLYHPDIFYKQQSSVLWGNYQAKSVHGNKIKIMANVGPSGEPIMTPDRAINFQIVYSIKKNQ